MGFNSRQQFIMIFISSMIILYLTEMVLFGMMQSLLTIIDKASRQTSLRTEFFFVFSGWKFFILPLFFNLAPIALGILFGSYCNSNRIYFAATVIVVLLFTINIELAPESMNSDSSILFWLLNPLWGIQASLIYITNFGIEYKILGNLIKNEEAMLIYSVILNLAILVPIYVFSNKLL